jgi:ribonuclease III
LLIEWGHKKKILIHFDTEEIKSDGDSPNQFLCQAFIHNTMMGEGSGTSKKEAQQNAARKAYDAVTNQSDFSGLHAL